MGLGVLGEYYTTALDFSFLFISLPGVLLYTIGATLLALALCGPNWLRARVRGYSS
jgi:hypothetical protein